MRIALILSITALVATPAVFVTQVQAAAPANSKMTQCAAQWQQAKTAGKTNGQDYKTYSAACMKGAAPAPAPAKAATPAKAAPKPVMIAAKSTAAKPQDRMKQCGAQWTQLKNAGKTGNQTYKQYSAACLKS